MTYYIHLDKSLYIFIFDNSVRFCLNPFCEVIYRYEDELLNVTMPNPYCMKG